MLHTLTTIRAATAGDAAALARLADSSRARRLRGRVLIAEGDQGVIAAIEVASGAVLADRSSLSAAAAHAVTLLRRHRYLVLRQAGGGAQVRSLFRREAARLAA
ncbi:MAG: hypothetical protein ACXVH3_09925 [Solirubrobacteraceae bacterium]